MRTQFDRLAFCEAKQKKQMRASHAHKPERVKQDNPHTSTPLKAAKKEDRRSLWR